MKISHKYLFLGLFFLLGIFFYLLKNNILVIKFLGFTKSNSSFIPNNSTSYKTNINLYYFKDYKFYKETREFVMFKDNIESIKHFIADWLLLLQSEKILKNNININSVLLSQQQDVVYLSFNKIFLDQEWSIFEKWNCIESLLKSLRETKFKFKDIVFLVDNKPMQDEHLDFSKPWSISGFYN
ncbi:MAG: hypothetical protein SZ59_C0002G0136 [candidate division TM6 bacterium GW2011_GWF2_28_16]|nr:MAG: hypothetical protein SZ59_C0002G0136 [candidate division TM6 bacterium GW2011_GWF2_28_16]